MIILPLSNSRCTVVLIMIQNLSIRKKILFLIGGTIAVLLIIASIFLVNHIASLSRSSVEQNAKHYIQSEKLSIESYFTQYGRLVETFVTNPHFIKWFENYNDRTIEPDNTAGFKEVNQDFIRISSNDDNILSAFFGSANTGVYFKENARTAQAKGEPYYAYKRPWWQEALNYNKLYVGSLSVDFSEGTVSSALQQPVYNASNKLIGVGGIDLQLNKIADMIEGINFNGQGYGFLLDEKQKVIHLSNKTGHNLSITDEDPKGKQGLDALDRDFKNTSGFSQLNSTMKSNLSITDEDPKGKQGLDALDRDFKNTSGFSQLNSTMKSNLSGNTTVSFKGNDYYVVYTRLQLDKPILDWYVGLLIPMNIIQDPVDNAVFTTSMTVLVILLIIAAVIFWATQMISKPISELTHVMQKIATGDGDLTKKIDINRTDEVGQLASHMNSFIAKLHTLLLKTASQAEQVGVASEHLSQVSYETNSEIQQEKEQVDSVSTAVTEMASTVLEISRNAQETNSAAEEVQSLTKVGTDISNEAQTAMISLASHIGEASQIVSGLEQESGNIGAVVDVINSIADQTNLLALNAAIEAARAGEQGRGFAVVADEVRSLASRTQESTDDIRNMITKLQQIAQQASTMMQEGKAQAESSVTQTQDVLASLTAISNSVTVVQDQSHQIATATEQQTLVAEDINSSLNAINDLVNNTSEHANELASEASDLNNLASGLNESVNQFKL